MHSIAADLAEVLRQCKGYDLLNRSLVDSCNAIYRLAFAVGQHQHHCGGLRFSQGPKSCAMPVA